MKRKRKMSDKPCSKGNILIVHTKKKLRQPYEQANKLSYTFSLRFRNASRKKAYALKNGTAKREKGLTFFM